jgi:hypothetical protein
MTMSNRVTVNRDNYDSCYEVEVRWFGKHLKATLLDPEEWPEPYAHAAWLNEKEIPVTEVPDDVLEEAYRLAEESGPEDDRTHDEDDDEPREREGDERDQPCRDSGIPGPQQFADWQKLK